MIRIAVFASGTGSNAKRLQEHFSDENKGIAVSLLVCNNKNAAVIEKMKAVDVPVLILSNNEFEKGSQLVEKLKEYRIDWIVLAGFLRKIPDNVIGEFTNRIINIHPSLLPKYGGKGMYGMHVHRAVVDNKEKESGISIHLVNEVYDGGAIVFQKSFAVLSDDHAEDVAQKVQALEHKYFPRVVEDTINKKRQ